MTNITPFFSILVPTRRRPELLAEAIESIVNQSFVDFEVVISNNGPCPETRHVAHRFCQDDPRIKYVEFENISMHEHWEQASKLTGGLYFLILTDRCLFFIDSLAKIHKEILEYDFPDIVSWNMQQYLDESCILLRGPQPGDASLITQFYENPTEIFLDELRGLHPSWSERIPRGMDSAVSQGLIKGMRERHACIFKPISPDFTFASFCLLNAKSFLYINKSLYISRGMMISNGGNSYSGELNSDFIISIGTDYEWLPNVPCKAMLVSNTIYSDYLRVASDCSLASVPRYFNVNRYYDKLVDEFEAKVLNGRVTRKYLEKLALIIVNSIADRKLKAHILKRIKLLTIVFYFYRVKALLLGKLQQLAPMELSSLRRLLILGKGHGIYYESASVAARQHRQS